MKREVLLSSIPIGTGHGEFFIEFIYKAHKAGLRVTELPYYQSPDIGDISKTASSIFRFYFHGFKYFLRAIQTFIGRN